MTTAPTNVSIAPPSAGRARTAGPGVPTMLIAFLIGAVLLLAAALKIVSWAKGMNAAAGVEGAQGPPVWDLLWSFAEIAIAFGVVLLRNKAWVWFLTALMFGGFAGYSALLWTRGEASCGCFGQVIEIAPSVMFFVDVALLALAIGVLTRRWAAPNLRGTALLIAGFGAAAGAGYASATTNPPAEENPVAVLRSLSVMDDVTDRSADKSWLVFVYRPGCPMCEQHRPTYMAFEEATEGSDLMGVKLFSVTDLDDIAAEEGKRLPEYAWTETPTTLHFRGGGLIERFGYDATPDPFAMYRELSGGEAPSAERAERSPSQRQSYSRVVDEAAMVRKLREIDRFDPIFADGPGAPAHLLYAHSNCGTCMAIRRQMLEVQDMVADRITLHFTAVELLEDDGIEKREWGGLHAALLFQGGELAEWYGVNQFDGDLPVTVFEEVAAP